MKLSIQDKEILKNYGYPEEDFEQVERAMLIKFTNYELDGKRISRKKAIELLGKEQFLSGIGRSAFHWSAARETKDGRVILFDSSNLFK